MWVGTVIGAGVRLDVRGLADGVSIVAPEFIIRDVAAGGGGEVEDVTEDGESGGPGVVWVDLDGVVNVGGDIGETSH